MTTPTVAVTIESSAFTGAAVAEGTATLQLTAMDVVGGTNGTIVTNPVITVQLDGAGKAVPQLFPNAVQTGLGTRGTKYKVTIFDSTGVQVGSGLATIPNAACNLHDHLDSLDNQPLTDGQVAVNLARSYRDQAANSIASVAYLYPGVYTVNPTTRPPEGTGAAIQAGDRCNKSDGYEYAYIGTTWVSSAKSAAASALSVAFLYPTPSATAPATRPDGSAIQNGDRYLNSTDSYEYVRINGVWTNAASSAQAAQVSAAAALVSQNSAGASASSASTNANQSLAAAATAGAYPNSAASNVPRGLTQASVGAITAGSGGTNGTFALGFSAGTGWLVYPTGTFTVAAGAVSAVTITGPGLCISGSPVVPTVSFAASSGLTGAAVALTTQLLIASGQGYWVASSDGNYLLRYKNVSGTATADASVGSVPTAAYLNSFFGHTLKSAWAQADGNGYEVARILAGASLDVQQPLQVDSLGGINSNSVALASRPVMKYLMAMADPKGNISFALDLNGKMIGDRSMTTGQTAQRPAGTYDYDIVYGGIYGQSLMIGQARPAISKIASAVNIMFAGGLRPQYDNAGQTDAQNYGSFVASVEVDSTVQSLLGETPCAGYGEMALQLMANEDGISGGGGVQFLLSAPGYGSMTIAALSKGTTHYNRVITQVTYGFNNATAANKSFGVPAIKYEQGESDYLNGITYASYLAAFKQLRLDFDTDIRAVVTTQAKNVHLVAMQLSSHKVGGRATPSIALAQLQAATDDPLIHIAGPMYMLSYQDSNNFHIQPWEERLVGAYMRICEKRVINDGLTWKPLQPVSSKRQGNTAYITMNVPVGKLVLDTSLVTLNTNYGFELFAADNVTPITISSVSLLAGNVVKIVAASAIPSDAHVHYAWSGTGNVGNGVGPRGNLRDQQGTTFAGHDAILFDNYPMHNWCVHFDWSL